MNSKLILKHIIILSIIALFILWVFSSPEKETSVGWENGVCFTGCYTTGGIQK